MFNTTSTSSDIIEDSPIIALRIPLDCKSVPPFDEYYFIDKDEEKIEHLKSSNINEWVTEFINSGRLSFEMKERALVFLDPFGCQVKWSTLKSLARTEVIDLWLLFPIGTVNRLLPLKKYPDNDN